ncbi:hypothetical protein F4818DRAFT_457450 [Hypoxylon cercidicola]|nr:hypothetical protein F4818DRAFT_457450 [Hypoxylon cercidicola]
MAPEEPLHQCSNARCNATSALTPLSPCDRCEKVVYCSSKCEAASWLTHKTACRLRGYVVKFHVEPGRVDNPPVTRILSCPAKATLSQLHKAVQVAFGWTSSSSSSFYFPILDVLNTEYVKVSQEQSQDLLERMPMLAMGPNNFDPNYEFPAQGGLELAVGVPELPTLAQALNPGEELAFQDAEGFVARRSMFSSEPASELEENPQPPSAILGLVEPDECKLYQLFDNPKYQGLEMAYVHDKGGGSEDWWEHRMTVTGLGDFTEEFACLDGTGHPISEGNGGPRGWERLKSMYRITNPELPVKIALRRYEWSPNGDPRGLRGALVHDWDRDQVNRDIRSMTYRSAARTLAEMTLDRFRRQSQG